MPTTIDTKAPPAAAEAPPPTRDVPPPATPAADRTDLRTHAGVREGPPARRWRVLTDPPPV